jgi:hypothetical protein
MSKTRAEIQKKALDILVGGDVGASMSDEDSTTLDGYIDSVVAEINADGTTYIGDPDDLDDELFLTFSKLVANAAAKSSAALPTSSWRKMRNRIRVITRQTPGYGPQEVEYF